MVAGLAGSCVYPAIHSFPITSHYCPLVPHPHSRETVKATVFGSHIAPPTMTLEEFGDREKADALAREAQKPEDGAAHANRRWGWQLCCVDCCVQLWSACGYPNGGN
jgi:hypothetical protein